MIGLTVILSALTASSALAGPAPAIDLEATVMAVARYRFGEEPRALRALEQLVRFANSTGGGVNEEFRRRLADRMAALLTSKDATTAAKAFVCEQLAVIGTEKQIPALAIILADKELGWAALRALSQIPGPAVDRHLCQALGRLTGDLKIGVVNALGQRRDQAAAASLIPLLGGANERLALAASQALGQVGGEAAIAALQKALATTKGSLRAEIAHACLQCAEKLLAEKKNDLAAALFLKLSRPGETVPVRMAGLRGIIRAHPDQAVSLLCQALTSGDPALEKMALQLVPEIPGETATEQIVPCLGKVPPAVRSLLLGALALRGDQAARAAVEAAASSQDRAVRLAALSALGVCGDRTSVKTLMARNRAGTDKEESETARKSLVRLRGAGVNEILTGFLTQRNTPEKKEAIRILAARNAVGSIPDLKKAAADPELEVRKESWKALGILGKERDVAGLLDLLVGTGPGEREEAEKAVTAVLKKSDRPDLRALLQKLDAAPEPQVHGTLLRIATLVGDDRALPALRRAVQASVPSVRDAAIRGLASWPTPAPFEDLAQLAAQAPDPVHRVLALRAAIRLSTRVEGSTPDHRTRLFIKLMQLAREPAEQKAVLAELGRCPTLEALHLAAKYQADPGLATEAGLALTQIASALRDQHRDEVLKALQPLLKGDRDSQVVGRAFQVLKDILKPNNLALGASATNPDGLAADGAAGGPGAAIDGDPNTYWDEVDGADLYRLKVTFPKPTKVSSINILWHPYEQHQAKNFDILCDGKCLKEVRKASCFENEMFVTLTPVRCTSVELVIPGKNGLISPAIHEFRIYGQFPPETQPRPVP